jgi:hypothetical protein
LRGSAAGEERGSTLAHRYPGVPAESPGRRRHLRPLDILVIAAAACAVAVSAAAVYSPGGGYLQIMVSGQTGLWMYPLDATGSVEVPGPLGTTVVRFGGGEVRITDSPCPTKSCVHMGAIRAEGQWLACLPNQVFVQIKGRSGNARPEAGGE